MASEQIIKKGLSAIEAAGIRTFKKEHFESLIKQLRYVRENHFPIIVQEFIMLDDKFANFVKFCINRDREMIKKIPKVNPDRWYIINNHCYRCNNLGVVPYLNKIEKENNNFIWQKEIFECDCINAKKIFKTKNKKKIKISKSYFDNFQDSHQFPFTFDILNSCKDKIDYQMVFNIYSTDFTNRLKKDKNAKPRFDKEFLFNNNIFSIQKS